MKNLKYIIISLAFVLGMSSCENYLDVNTDPDNPNSATATVNTRLPWIQNYYGYALGTAGMRANTILGLLTQTYASGANSNLAAWNGLQSSGTTVYQNWYVGSAVNIGPMITKAEETGANHYIGAGYCMYAMGFMMMLDFNGETPIQEAFIGKPNPTYDDGKSVFYTCIDYLDLAIAHFQQEQGAGSPALSEGDIWNGGDVNKWLKLCYGLKARYLLKLSKKADLYDGDAILTALQNAPQSNLDNTIMRHYNVQGDQLNFTVGDPYQTNIYWNCVAYGTAQRTTRYYVNLLTNNFTGGSGVIDPRMTKLLPAMMSNIKLNASGEIASYEWRRDVGVDMLYDDIRTIGGPLNTTIAAAADVELKYTIKGSISARDAFAAAAGAIHPVQVPNDTTVVVTYKKGSAYVNSTDYRRAGDTVYVNMRANSMSTSGRGINDMYYYPIAGYNYVAGTGTFYARPDSDTDLLTYAEMCFIKAEVYMRKNDLPNAFNAYKAGIQAHFDRMQSKLGEWQAAGTTNPDQMPMNPADIAAYMSSAAVVQSATALTMADIMRQKTIAMGFNMENWNDARRFNYSTGNIGTFGNVYPDYKRPYEFTATNKITGTVATDATYWIRRVQQSSHESNYNLEQLLLSNKQAMKDPVWSIPVWWDCATDEEYYGYIK